MTCITYSLDQLSDVALTIWKTCGQTPIWLLSAPMGAGKTTFTKALVAAAGSNDEVASPTFGLVNPYSTPDGRLVYHWDLYRVQSLAELESIGFWDYLDQDALNIIEWPDLIRPVLEANEVPILSLTIEMGLGNTRVLCWEQNV